MKVIKCLPEETIFESHASLGALEDSLLAGQVRALRLDIEERPSVRTVACETRHLVAEQISEET